MKILDRPDLVVKPSDFLTVCEAAVWLRVHRNTIYKMIRDGRLPAFKVGRAWRVRVEGIHILSQTRAMKATLRQWREDA